MPHRRDLSGTIVHRHTRIMCWLPVWDRSGLWPVRTWLFWTWDYAPAAVAARTGELLGVLRGRL